MRSAAFANQNARLGELHEFTVLVFGLAFAVNDFGLAHTALASQWLALTFFGLQMNFRRLQ